MYKKPCVFDPTGHHYKSQCSGIQINSPDHMSHDNSSGILDTPDQFACTSQLSSQFHMLEILNHKPFSNDQDRSYRMFHVNWRIERLLTESDFVYATLFAVYGLDWIRMWIRISEHRQVHDCRLFKSFSLCEIGVLLVDCMLFQISRGFWSWHGPQVIICSQEFNSASYKIHPAFRKDSIKWRIWNGGNPNWSRLQEEAEGYPVEKRMCAKCQDCGDLPLSWTRWSYLNA